MKKCFFWSILIAINIFSASQVSAADSILSATYIDTNTDGRVDHLKWVFDKNITQCIFENRDWTVDVGGDMKIQIIGIDRSDPEATGEGMCNGQDPVLYLSVRAEDKKTGSRRDPVVSYKNKGANNSLQDENGIISDKPRYQNSDGIGPLITKADLNLNDNISKLVLLK